MKITSNKSKRHYTIIKNGIKYRTIKMSQYEFNNCSYNTINDWINYLKYSQDYYIVK